MLKHCWFMISLLHCLRHSLFMRLDKSVLKLISQNLYLSWGQDSEFCHYWHPRNHLDKSGLTCIRVLSLGKHNLGSDSVWHYFLSEFSFPKIWIDLPVNFLNYFWEVNKWRKRSIELKMFCNWEVCLPEIVAAFLQI